MRIRVEAKFWTMAARSLRRLKRQAAAARYGAARSLKRNA